MKKILSLAVSIILILTLAVSCTSGNTSDNDNTNDTNISENELSDTIKVTDHLGYEVEVPREIDRIVVAKIYPLPSVISIFFDSAEKIVGMPDQCMSAAKNSLLSQLYPEILNAKTDFISDADINMESLLLLEPDVVFYSSADVAHGEALREAGIPAVAVSANKWEYDAIETLENWIDLLSQIFPENNKVDVVKSYSEDVYNKVSERVSKLSDEEKKDIFFLFQYNENMIATSGNRFFGQWWASAIGAVNVAGDVEKENALPVNMEQIYKWNPDCILITNYTPAKPENIYNNTIGSNDWSEITAVKNKEVYKMPLGMYRSYTCGVDTPVTLLWMAKTVYPDLFTDIDITEETKKYYNEVFGITLTDEQAEMIFAPNKDASAFN